jgi:hypothetical protein
MWAQCWKCPESVKQQWDGEKYIHPIMPRKNHSCGIYATLSWRVLRGYLCEATTAFPMLVEGVGNGWLEKPAARWEVNGFISSGVQVIHMIDVLTLPKEHHREWGNADRVDKRRQASLAACEKFDVSLISWDLACEMARIQWTEKYGRVWIDPNEC